MPELFDIIWALFVPKGWGLFINSSMANLKAVLLRNKSKFFKLLLAYSDFLGENYGNVKLNVELLQYNRNK